MSISLIIKCGENTTKFLIKPKLTFGRSKTDVDISIDDKRISSKHLEITYENREIIIKDLKSTNGTYINNQKIELPQRLFVYETVRIGNCYITINVDDLTDLELKEHTKEIDHEFDSGEVTKTNTKLADQTSFLSIGNKLSLQQLKPRHELKKDSTKPRPMAKRKKKPKEEVEEDNTVMTKIFKFFK